MFPLASVRFWNSGFLSPSHLFAVSVLGGGRQRPWVCLFLASRYQKHASFFHMGRKRSRQTGISSGSWISRFPAKTVGIHQQKLPDSRFQSSRFQARDTLRLQPNQDFSSREEFPGGVSRELRSHSRLRRRRRRLLPRRRRAPRRRRKRWKCWVGMRLNEGWYFSLGLIPLLLFPAGPNPASFVGVYGASFVQLLVQLSGSGCSQRVLSADPRTNQFSGFGSSDAFGSGESAVARLETQGPLKAWGGKGEPGRQELPLRDSQKMGGGGGGG